MKVTFYSNYINDHQIPFCEEMYKHLGNDYTFVATEQMDEERIRMGFKDLSDNFSYVIKSYKDKESYDKALKLGLNSDVVIIGSAPEVFIEERLKQNKTTFRYCERYFKEGRWRILDPRVLYARYKYDYRYRNKNLYMLCAGAYTAPDCRFIHSYPGRTFKWGYFPTVKKYDDIDKLLESKKHASILWTGRLIEYKHPELAIEIAKMLKESSIDFILNIIGTGTLEGKIRELINKYNLNDCVRMLGSMSPNNVRKYMEESEIFLFTSDRNEGWGAVLNEAMNSGCAVIANDEIGSVPFLIKNNVNGLVYHNNSESELYDKLKTLLSNKELSNRLGKNANFTIKDMWNAKNATNRLLELLEGSLNNNIPEFKEGPCSRC